MSRCEREAASVWRHSASILMVLTTALSLPAFGADEGGSPWVINSWLETGGGYEEESLVDPNINRAAVPGGPFVNLTPRAWFWKELSSATAAA